MRWRRGRPIRRPGPGLALAVVAAGAALITLPSTHSSASGPNGPSNRPATRASARAAVRVSPGRVGSNRPGTTGPRPHPTGGRTPDGPDLDRWRPGRRDGTDSADGADSPALVLPPGPGLPTPTPVTADRAPTTPLPAAETRGRRVIVVLSPHPDDETLSLGTWIANATARGDRVVLVSLTDGRSTGAIGTVSTRLGRPVTRDEIAGARTQEMHQAAALLGIAPADVLRAGLDGDHTPGGTRITVGETAAVIDALAERFPDAVFATMSWVAEHHPDHLNAGRALYEAAISGEVRHATFAVSRLWWSLPAPTSADVLPASAGVREQVLAAAAAYEIWDPAHQRYAVGRLSVNGQFAALRADPRSRVHGAPHTPAPLTAP